jgi:hypothetical protein
MRNEGFWGTYLKQAQPVDALDLKRFEPRQPFEIVHCHHWIGFLELQLKISREVGSIYYGWQMPCNVLKEKVRVLRPLR